MRKCVCLCTYMYMFLQSISLTNYTGVERELVKEMARVIGVAYTSFLDRNTTHLVCKKYGDYTVVVLLSYEFQHCRAGGRKYEKALEWGITTVNSTFLADILHSKKLCCSRTFYT